MVSRRVFPIFGSVALIAAVLSAAPAGVYSAGICEGARPVDGGKEGQVAEVDFLRVDLLPRADGGSADPPAQEIVSFDPDVLLVSPQSAPAKVALSGFGGRVESVVCIEYRPEMLALVLRNGAEDLRNASMRAEVVRDGGKTVLFGRLPSLPANQATRILLSSSSALVDAEAITLLVNPSPQ